MRVLEVQVVGWIGRQTVSFGNAIRRTCFYIRQEYMLIWLHLSVSLNYNTSLSFIIRQTSLNPRFARISFG